MFKHGEGIVSKRCGSTYEEPGLINAPEVEHRANRLLAALPREILEFLDRDLRQASLEQGVVCRRWHSGDLAEFSRRPA